MRKREREREIKRKDWEEKERRENGRWLKASKEIFLWLQWETVRKNVVRFEKIWNATIGMQQNRNNLWA